MKVIVGSKITSISADTENASYPASELLNRRVRWPWIATAAHGELSVMLAPGASGFALFGCNAHLVQFFLNFNPLAWETGVAFEEGVAWEEDLQQPSSVIKRLNGTVRGACMCEWTPSAAPARLTVKMSNIAGDIIQGGRALAGVVKTYPGPEYEMREWLEDSSLISKNNDASEYIVDGDTWRMLRADVNMLRDTAFMEFIDEVAPELKSQPTAWVVTGLEDPRWLVHARINRHPEGDHYNYARTRMGFELKEVIY